MTALDRSKVEQAAESIAAADAIVVAAGAGMGVDSGLPDFRGNEGFWRTYPPLRRLGVSFAEMANPSWFERDPELAWGFYGHRLNLYRATRPHLGFEILRRWGDRADHGCFVFTSNVDGQFQVAGFDASSIAECHGSIHHLQCTAPCCDAIWDAAGADVEVDESSFRARGQLPTCPSCGRLARPNVLMFGDWSWLSHRTDDQHRRMASWFRDIDRGPLVVIELGAGTAVPTVRMTSERAASGLGCTLIRINLREPAVPPRHVGFAAGALETLAAIEERLSART
jgi:NAD-dependent SIR2 family protein deacetylase